MSWRDYLAGFDLETDSPDHEDARIVTACVGIANSGGWTPKNWLLQPDRDIAESATAIHGISTEMARIDGTDRADGLKQIAAAIRAAWAAGAVLVSHNSPYDLTVLDRELRRAGHGPLTIAGPVVDTLVLDKAVDRFRKGKRTLTATAAHYGFELTEADAHGAEADALASCRIAWRIAAAHLEVGQMDADTLTQWQADQYREQRLSFAAYRRKRGEPLDDESTDWPLRPWTAQPSAA